VGYLLNDLRAMTTDSQQPVGRLPLLSSEERTLLLETWNRTEAPYPQHLCIHQLFEQQVERTPAATAVIYEQLSLTYRELNIQANRLAHHLIALGVHPDEPVALCIERSPAMIVALLAILKAGGAYVPLDPTYPSQRLAQILTDAAPRLLLCDTAGLNALGQYTAPSLTVIPLNAPSTPWADLPQSNPDPHALALTSRNLAYIIYTSGSTGSPKGVMVEHRSVCNYLHWAGFVYSSQRGSVVSSSLAFDATVTSLYTPLLRGGVITLLPESEELEALKLFISQQSQQKSRALVKTTPTLLAIFVGIVGR
jgi:non-ribosomal peptide synthetase component F